MEEKDINRSLVLIIHYKNILLKQLQEKGDPKIIRELLKEYDECMWILKEYGLKYGIII